jgi:hypothetical protein
VHVAPACYSRGASLTKWAIEYEEPAGEAFGENHPEAAVFVENCNVILKYVRPRFFLLENVRNFISFNKGQTFRLTAFGDGIPGV